MRLLGVLLVFGLVFSVCGKSSVKATESMGQEVIEIGHPVKGLPPDIEEEPSAEVDDDDKPVSVVTTAQPPKTKEVKKTTTLGSKPETRRKAKEMLIDGDEDDAKIEKELSEIYKDNADYKEEKDGGKPIGRAGGSFKFQPDLNNPREVERFRTSIDEISCSKSVTKLTVDDNGKDQQDSSKNKPAYSNGWRSLSGLPSTLTLITAMAVAY